MNQIFNLHRFRILFTKTIMERPVQIFGPFALSFSMVILVYFLFKSLGNFGAGQLFSFIIGLVGGGCLLASLVMGYFSDNANSASFLTLPASAFEKWLCAVILVGILFLFSFLLFYRGVDALFVHFYHNGLNLQDPRFTDQYNAVYLFSFSEAKIIIVFFLNAASAMLVGSLYFNKIGFIKVALFICGLYFFAFLLNSLINSFLFENLVNSYPFHSARIKNGDEFGTVGVPNSWNQFFDIVCQYVLPIILLIVSYIRLTEKEA
jgi:hypothetical protein